VRALIWFRSDLRTDDNPALTDAVHRADRGVIGVFVCTPEQWREHDWGAPKLDFLLRNLKSLSAELQRMGISLVIRETPRFDGVAKLLGEVRREFSCDALFFNLEYEFNERIRDRQVVEELESHSVPTFVSEDQTVVPPARLRTSQGRFYKVFTPFKKRWLSYLLENGVPDPIPGPVATRGRLDVMADPAPSGFEGFPPVSGQTSIWPAGEAQALARLEAFVDERIGQYDEARDLASVDSTSRLSPYLALGVLSVRRCLTAALAANRGELEGGNQGVAVWITELVWREFYRHVLVGFPRLSKGRAFRPNTEDIVWRDDPEGFDLWCKGQTGVPFVDAGMRQLATTGWMHNRLRMVTAMFLTKDLLIDWRLGERFFMRRLVDADLANNNGGWQWSASTGTDAAPYFRIFNPWAQGQRFDRNAEFIKRHVPELRHLKARVVHDPRRLADTNPESYGYCRPVVGHKMARVRALDAFEAVRDQK
jgi:deoxyribodipyrimidine photo-lyase